MKFLTQAFIVAMFLAAGAASAQTEPAIDNPAIDMRAFCVCRPKPPVRARAGGSPKAISSV